MAKQVDSKYVVKNRPFRTCILTFSIRGNMRKTFIT